MKLRDIGVSGEHSKCFISDVFGEQQGSHIFCGLVDCDSSEEFDAQLLQLEDTWNKRECTAVNRSVPEFHAWFTQYQAANMKSKMLKPLRKKVGLLFTTQIMLMSQKMPK